MTLAVLDPHRAVTDPDDPAVSLAAQLCWHAVRICQAVAVSLDSLQDDLAEISRHCDALIELALDRQTAETDASHRGIRR